MMTQATLTRGANVSGLGTTKRISLNDNLLNNGTKEEIKAVMGHELGHYVLGHITVLIVLFTLILGLGFLFVTKTYGWAANRWGVNWGIQRIDDIAVLPLAAVFKSVPLYPVFCR